MKPLSRCLRALMIVFALLPAVPVLAAGADDPLLSMIKLDQFEWTKGQDESPWVFEGEAWLGHDLKKLWLKSEVERADGEIEEAEVQLLYSQAASPFWDFQLGVRRDFEPSPSRNWAVIGWQGIAPYFLETDVALFVGESGRTAMRVSAEYEMLLSQRLILSPEIEMNFHGQQDSALGIGSGLSNAEIGLRLRYEIRREFAPYIGVNWSSDFGETSDLTRAAGAEVEETKIVLGVRAWF